MGDNQERKGRAKVKILINLKDNLASGRVDMQGSYSDLHVIPRDFLRRAFVAKYLHNEGYYFFETQSGQVYLDYAPKDIYESATDIKELSKVYVPEILGDAMEFILSFEHNKETPLGAELRMMLSLTSQLKDNEEIPLWEGEQVQTEAEPEADLFMDDIENGLFNDTDEPMEITHETTKEGRDKENETANQVDDGINEPYQTEQISERVEPEGINQPDEPEEISERVEPEAINEPNEPEDELTNTNSQEIIDETPLIARDFVEIETTVMEQGILTDNDLTGTFADQELTNSFTDLYLTNEHVENDIANTNAESNLPNEPYERGKPVFDLWNMGDETDETYIEMSEDEDDKEAIKPEPVKEESEDTIDKFSKPWFFVNEDICTPVEDDDVRPLKKEEEEEPELSAELDFEGMSIEEMLEAVKEEAEKEETFDDVPYYLISKNTNAEGRYIEGKGFVLFKGANICPYFTNSCPSKIIMAREQATAKGLIKDNTTTEDITFKRANDASGFVLGGSPGSVTNWHTCNGLTLREASMGIDIPTEDSEEIKQENIYTIQRQGLDAKLYYDAPYFWVLKGSRIEDMKEDSKASEYTKKVRNVFRHVIDDTGRLKTSIRFTTPSGASSFIAGRDGISATAWRNKANLRLSDRIK